MPIFRPFAYNPSVSSITGASQFGNLAIGNGTVDYSTNPGGVKWFSGPDEENGYVIALAVTGGNQPTADGLNDGTVQFWRSGDKTDSSFIALADVLSNGFGGSGPFVSATGAKEWLDTNNFWNSYFKYIVSAGRTTSGGYQIGSLINKDMFGPNAHNYPSAGLPNGVSTNISADAWTDWGEDIFDTWGYFYLYDPGSAQYLGLTFNTKNQADGTFATQSFTLNGRNFTITQGYPVQGIFKFEIRCSDGLPFVFGEGGNMGSDSSTANIDQSYNYTLDGVNLTLWYNENYQLNVPNERFYSYFVPFVVDENNTKTYTDVMVGSDNLYLYSRQCTYGLTVYHSKQYDVKEWVVYDLTFGE